MKWNTAWSYVPIDYNTTIGTVENITQRTFIKNNITGNAVKIKFSNRYSKEELILDKVVIGQMEESSEVIHTLKTITHLGKEKIMLEPGQEFFSDEVSWSIQAGTKMVLYIYIKEKTNIQSASSTWAARSWNTVYGLEGDYTEKQRLEEKQSREVYPFVEADANKSNIIVGISEIMVHSEQEVKTIALFGDSITHMSYYSDALIERIYPEYPSKITVVNRGIGGNRLLHDASFVPDMPGNGSCFGVAACKRFEQDVYGSDCPEMVIIMEGVNDMMHPYVFGHMEEVVSAKDLQSGIERLVQIAHEKGSKVYLGTVMPFRNDEFEWLPESEAVRLELNEWIRNQKIAEGFIDFAKIIESEENPQYMMDGYHIGDGLHPNTEGGIAMATAIPLEWIQEGIE